MTHRRSLPGRVTAVALVGLAFAARPTAAADPVAGEALYRQHCTRCHGKAGEGTAKYKHSLTGDRSVGQLARVIDQTMPEDDPDKLDAKQSADVAAYIHAAFYSPAAQARNKPARVELARLTVAQYRYTVADLVGSFRAAPAKRGAEEGLKGEYFADRGFRNDKKVLDRLDPEVRFDFKTDGPVAGKTDAHTFAIRWQGTVIPPETGEYTFVVRTEHGTRLWVNDPRTPLIDAWVKSGSDTEYKGSAFLLAGRPYPIRLEFSKATQGVQDRVKKPPKPVPASVALLWKPPHGVVSTVPSRHLSPAWAPESFVVTTPLPADDRSLGWERGTTVSRAWDAATTDAALEAAGYVADRLGELAGVKDGAADRPAKLKEFARKFVERAFRRPLTDEQKALYVDRQFAESADPAAAVKRSVLLALKSPRFLYREVGGSGADGYDVAARLSFALWDTGPDAELMMAAGEGKLATPEQVRKQAERMAADPKATAKLHAFLMTWLKLDQPPDLMKDGKKYPGFDDAVAADLRASLELSLADVLRSDAADFRALLKADEWFVNGRLAKFYGTALPADAPFRKAKAPAGPRAGVLTHPYLLAAFAYTGTSSPIHRGVFLARSVLGVNLKPPADAFSPLAEDLHPTLTTRERTALQTKSAACMACHETINNLGFTLENYDAVGRFRSAERGKPVDVSGLFETRTGDVVRFAGPTDLARFLADSPDVHAAFAEQLFHHLVKQPVRAYGPDRLDKLRAAFAGSNYNVRKLAVDIAASSAATGHRTEVSQAPRPVKP